MPYLLLYYPQCRDTSRIIDYLEKAECLFKMEQTYEELAPFAEACALKEGKSGDTKETVDPLPAVEASPVAAKRITDSPPRKMRALELTVPKEEVGETQLTQCPYTGFNQINGEDLLGSLTDSEAVDGLETEAGEDEAKNEEEMEPRPSNVQLPVEVSCPAGGCDVVFSTVAALIEHMALHTPPMACRICNNKWHNHTALREHFLRHTTNLFCILCLKTFDCASDFMNHQKIHDEDTPNACFVCGDVCTSKADFCLHMFNRHRTGRHFCNLCCRSFDHFNQMSAHMAAHSGKEIFSCEICFLEYGCADGLKRHMSMNHKAGKKFVACNICGRGYASHTGLRAHKKKMHPG